jgi:hypothetical protein
MAKLCLSSLFSISLAEFYSSNNLRQTLKCNNKLTLRTKCLFNPVLETLKQSDNNCDNIGDFEIYSSDKIIQQKLFIEACQLMITLIVIRRYLMERVATREEVLAVAAAAVWTVSSHQKMTLPLCPHLQMEAMVG